MFLSYPILPFSFHQGLTGDLRATWEELGEIQRGRRGRRTGATFEKDGVGMTDWAEIAGKFCDFYCQSGPKLAEGLEKELVQGVKDKKSF